MRPSSGCYLAALAAVDFLFLVLHLVFELQNAWDVATLKLRGVCELFPVFFLALQYLSVLHAQYDLIISISFAISVASGRPWQVCRLVQHPLLPGSAEYMKLNYLGVCVQYLSPLLVLAFTVERYAYNHVLAASAGVYGRVITIGWASAWMVGWKDTATYTTFGR